MLDSLVRVSRRVAEDHYDSILAEARSSVPAGSITQRTITHLKLSATFPKALSFRQNRCCPKKWQVHNRELKLITTDWVWSQALPFQQFHVLFNSLFKVLFIFRSLYLCAIGLSPIFSFRWNLPPILSCIPKQLDSSNTYHMLQALPLTGFSPSVTSCSKELKVEPSVENVSWNYNSMPKGHRFQIWAFAASLAVTKAIPVGFFSSAYWYA
jgi:hypothetical protein